MARECCVHFGVRWAAAGVGEGGWVLTARALWAWEGPALVSRGECAGRLITESCGGALSGSWLQGGRDVLGKAGYRMCACGTLCVHSCYWGRDEFWVEVGQSGRDGLHGNWGRE